MTNKFNKFEKPEPYNWREWEEQPKYICKKCSYEFGKYLYDGIDTFEEHKKYKGCPYCAMLNTTRVQELLKNKLKNYEH